MARKNNDGKNKTDGHGEMDFVTPPNAPVSPTAFPGIRLDTDSTWVVRDRLWKESQPVPKYY